MYNKMNSLSTSIACRLVLLPIQVLGMGYNPGEGVREMLAEVVANELVEEVLLSPI